MKKWYQNVYMKEKMSDTKNKATVSLYNPPYPYGKPCIYILLKSKFWIFSFVLFFHQKTISQNIFLITVHFNHRMFVIFSSFLGCHLRISQNFTEVHRILQIVTEFLITVHFNHRMFIIHMLQISFFREKTTFGTHIAQKCPFGLFMH